MVSKFRTVFFGTPELAVPSLAAIAEAVTLTALVCQPDRPKGRKKTPTPPPTKDWAIQHGLEVNQPTKLNDGAFESWLRDQRPDCCALVAYGRILKQPILDVPPHGFLNMHPSALPKYRGPSPIQGALLDGATETAISIMRLDAGMDSGDVLLQSPVPIADADTTETLSVRLAERGAEMMIEALGLVESGTATYTPQDDDAATFTTMLSKADGRIDWNQPATSIHNLVRAAKPWPMAACILDDEVLRVHKSHVVDSPNSGPPGTVIESDKNDLHIATSEGILAIDIIQAIGKRPLPIGDFLRGRAIAAGARFEVS